jgi:hypothetical protein
MTTKNGTRTAIRQALLAAATGAGALLVPAAPAAAADGCPPGQIEDAQTPGFQCVWDCPPGTLMDGVSGTCVTAPGLPPPPLP